jgi:hypothetical protein
MSIDRVNDLRAFRDFASARLILGCETTLDEALDPWQAENQCDPPRPDDVRAVREALDDMYAGDEGVPLKEAVAALRRSSAMRCGCSASAGPASLPSGRMNCRGEAHGLGASGSAG